MLIFLLLGYPTIKTSWYLACGLDWINRFSGLQLTNDTLFNEFACYFYLFLYLSVIWNKDLKRVCSVANSVSQNNR